MIIVTGGAGFIGSCIIRSLNDTGRNDILVVDDIGESEKWLNLRNKRYLAYVHKSRFLAQLNALPKVDAIIHMGAQSSTTERDFDYLWQNNFEYTKSLWHYCSEHQIPFIYASSAATYGGGENGFDDKMDIDCLRPLNAYGYSKQLFDLWVKHQATSFPPQYVGLKFFNVYGPNEYYKGSMASMVFHGFNQIQESGEIRLFKSYDSLYRDGGQLRDFIYVKDICSIILWFLKSGVSGLYNVGTGKARAFQDLALAVFSALNIDPNIRYIEMPDHLKAKYQYFTQADITSLRNAGYLRPFRSLEEGVKDYVQNYLVNKHLNY